MQKHDILLVDGDEDILDSLRLVLEAEGFFVRQAANGRLAVQEIERRRPDLVILDFMMSTDVAGLELDRDLEDREDLGGLPIIVLTSFLDRITREDPDSFQNVLGGRWSAVWVFEKPVSPSILLEKIRGLIEVQ
jgi:two-component system response regulator ChvI